MFRAFKALEEFRGFGAMSDASAAGATVRKELPTHEKSAMVSYTHHLENFGYSSKSKRTSHAIAHHHLLRRPLSGINGKQALEYFNAMATGSKQTIKSKLKILKRFLACCLKANFIIEDYSGLFPSAKKRRYAGIPSVYKPAETATLLDCLKGSSQSRKRNYALALLIAVYGFRSGDIAGMIPCDIDWDDGIIRIVQPKAKSVAERRLFPHAGNALASCLLEERPGNGNPHVFLKQDGGQLASTSASSMIFNALLNCWIYINGRKHGSHSLRHSLAGNMPASDSGMLEASKALGHESADAAKIYYGKKAIMERKPLWKVKPGVYRFY